MSYTKGPWNFRAYKGPRDIRLKRQHWMVGEATSGGLGVALVFGDDDANARLIAAAPDLLEACKRIAACFDGVEYDEIPVGAIEDIRAAIKKAEEAE